MKVVILNGNPKSDNSVFDNYIAVRGKILQA